MKSNKWLARLKNKLIINQLLPRLTNVDSSILVKERYKMTEILTTRKERWWEGEGALVSFNWSLRAAVDLKVYANIKASYGVTEQCSSHAA